MITKEGRELLEKTVQWLRNGGDDGEVAFNLATWMSPKEDFQEKFQSFTFKVTNYNTQCNTICCIGGYIAYQLKSQKFGHNDNVGIMAVMAAEFLGVDEEAADNLFFPKVLFWQSVTPQRAAEAVQTFLDTNGEKSWDVFEETQILLGKVEE
jgi:hypothetical protein